MCSSRLDQLEVQPAYRRRGSEHASAEELADLSRSELAARIAADPANYVAQERVTRSTAPTWSAGDARSRRTSRCACSSWPAATATP